MAHREVWVNEDGLEVPFGPEDSVNDNLATVRTEGNVEVATMVLDYDHLPAAAGTAPSQKSIPVPANSVILRAYMRVDEEFTSGGATTIDIGFVDEDGTAIDQDGLFAEIAKSDLDSGDVVEGEGDLVGENVGEADAYISTAVTTGPYTAGQAVLTVEYLRPVPGSTPQEPIDGIVGSL